MNYFDLRHPHSDFSLPANGHALIINIANGSPCAKAAGQALRPDGRAVFCAQVHCLRVAVVAVAFYPLGLPQRSSMPDQRQATLKFVSLDDRCCESCDNTIIIINYHNNKNSELGSILIILIIGLSVNPHGACLQGTRAGTASEAQIKHCIFIFISA